MGEIVNLRRVKKAKRRVADAEAAQENRVRHGRTGAQKASDEQARMLQAKRIDNARLGTAPD